MLERWNRRGPLSEKVAEAIDPAVLGGENIPEASSGG